MAVKQKKGRFANLNERQRAAHLAAGMALLVQGSILSGALTRLTWVVADMKCIPTGFSEATGIGATLIALLDQRWPTEKLTWDFDPEHKGRRWFNEMYAMAQPKHAYLDDFAEHFRMSRSSFDDDDLALCVRSRLRC